MRQYPKLKRPASSLRKKPASLVFKKPAAMRKVPYVPYVRHGMKTSKARPEQSHWKRSLVDLFAVGDKKIIDILKEDKLLPEWKGKSCPRCAKGVLGPLKKYLYKGWRHRCSQNKCQCYIAPHSYHPLFSSSSSRAMSLQMQASILFALTCGCKEVHIHKLFDKNHKAIERLSCSLDHIRKLFVERTEKSIVFGTGAEWMDVEADEVDISKALQEDPVDSTKPVEWEQWAGVVMRGFPNTLVLKRLSPKMTKKRAPGPGAIRKTDWRPIAGKLISGRKVILHSDGARSYKLRLPGVLHDAAIHKKKKVMVKGKMTWVNPKYSMIHKHTTPEGDAVYVKTGTQIIDRFWGFLRQHLQNRPKTPKSTILRNRIRSAQYMYWYRTKDLWLVTGETLAYLRDHGVQ